MQEVTQGEINVGRESLRRLGASLEPAWILRTPTGPDYVVLEDGRSFPVPSPDVLPHHPEVAAAIVERARQQHEPQRDDVVGDLPVPSRPADFPYGFSDKDTGDKPWWPYSTGDSWWPYNGQEFATTLGSTDGFGSPDECRRRCNFLNLLASGEPIEAV